MKRIALLWGLFLLLTNVVVAQTSGVDDYEKAQMQVQAVYIYNFTQYFIWPPERNSGDFVIGVLGETKIIEEFNKMARLRKVNGRTIKIKKFSSPAEIGDDCHILYVPHEFSNYLSDVLNKTNNCSTLIISNKEGLGKFGSTLNFTAIKGKPTFELNLDAIKKRRLKCAQQLKSIAILI